jgi:hypothetical protein
LGMLAFRYNGIGCLLAQLLLSVDHKMGT